MKNTLTIQFANAEDCAWALSMIRNAQERNGKIADGPASILLCALGRSVNVTGMDLEQARKITAGIPVGMA